MAEETNKIHLSSVVSTSDKSGTKKGESASTAILGWDSHHRSNNNHHPRLTTNTSSSHPRSSSALLEDLDCVEQQTLSSLEVSEPTPNQEDIEKPPQSIKGPTTLDTIEFDPETSPHHYCSETKETDSPNIVVAFVLLVRFRV